MKMIQIPMLILSLLLMCCTCKDDENCHDTITFKNATTDTLYVVSSSQYPDTSTFVGIPNPVLDPNFTKVLPNESNTQVLWSRDCIELDFKDLTPSDTMMVYVFDAQILETTPWDTVKAKYLVLKRYDLSLQDLEDKNWTITYP